MGLRDMMLKGAGYARNLPWGQIGKVAGLNIASLAIAGGIVGAISPRQTFGGGAFHGPIGYFRGGIEGGLAGGVLGVAYSAIKGARTGSALLSGAGVGAMYGALIGGSYGFFKDSIFSNKPVNPIRGLHQ